MHIGYHFSGCVIIVGVLLTAELTECLECFNCQNIADPHACTNTSQCSNGQSCFLQSVHNGNDERYNMGCQSNQLCSSSGVDTGAIIGRAIQRRQHYACHECCSTSSCNDQLCAHRKPSACVDDPTLDCARLNSLFNVCADVHHVKATCPKFCGLCQLVDGNWADWGTWATCSVTCQTGTQTRARNCTNPSPSNGGLDCSGSAVQTKICSNQLCPVHGNWSDWSQWSGCSVSCDVGLKKRTRTCTNPKPDRSGDFCVGDTSEYTVCLTDPCYTRNGGWSSWGSWQGCSVTCGVGQKLQHRSCTNPSPSAYGKACEGNTEAFAVCVNRPCTTVAFIAHGVNIISNRVSAFPTTIFNEGDAYNSSTGRFTAPVDGMYFFSTQFCTSAYAYFAIEKGSASMNNITRLTASLQQTPDVSCASASTHVQLSENETVWVRMDRQYGSANFYESSDIWNFFTGTLTQEM
ncbi:coadhesin-like isoform X2 [Dreissena polymorpha]|uniref:coadhesin-like isoform X2 n=1 Tax=Dreissena polymorpha TaxID=45954 RepID=UPI002264729D|nr:coadhesin-like isoform X2 [Dreissena polymorpha]